MLAAPAGSYLPTAAGQPTREAVAREFFSTHSDSYDFLVVFPAFQTGFVDEAGLHTSVRSTVEGLGRSPQDLGAAFGSPARLKAYLDVRALDPTQPQLSVEAAIVVAAHEVAHQFAAFVGLQVPGLAPDALRGRNSSHWSFFLDSDASVLYGSDWVAGAAPGTWRAQSSKRRYSALDLYLMGLLAASEVPAMQLLEPTMSSGFLQSDLPPPDGTVVGASARTIRIEDIIAANGARSPSIAASHKSFRAAFVLLLPPGQSIPTQAQLDFVDAVRRRFANDFFFMTRGRAVMQTDLLEAPPAPLASTPDLQRAVDYLLARQEASGDWQDTSATRVRDTQLALEALASFSSDARVPASLQRGGVSLSQSAPDGVDAAARRALGLLAAHQPVSSVSAALESYVDRNGLNADKGYGYTRGYSSTVLDTLLAVQALRASGATETSLAPTLAWLISKQNSDGGWPPAGAGESRVGSSSLVLATLTGQPPGSAGAIAAARGVQFLRTQRLANGSFGEADSLAPTALALLALDAWSELTAAEASAGSQFLLSRQWSDGSFGASVSETATVIKALRRIRSPNLQINPSDVTLSRTQTMDGDLVQASIVVRNTGYIASPATELQAVDSSLAALSPLRAVPSIAAGGSAVVSVVLDTTGHGGSSQVFFAVDPQGTVDETREDDNRVASGLLVQPPPQTAELTVGALAVSAPLSSLPGVVTVTAAIHNVGQTAALNAVVELQVAGQTFRASVDLAPRSVTAVPLNVVVTQLVTPLVATVTVDPDGVIAEPIEDNNSASIAVPVTPTVDVSVVQLVATPSAASQGQSIVVSFNVANRGTADASDGRVDVLLKSTGGSLVATLSTISVPVPAGGVSFRSVTVRVPNAGIYLLEVMLSATGDATPADNAAAVSVTITPSTLANLTVAPGSLTISPQPPLQGVAASVTAVVTNDGATAATGAIFELWAGAPPTGTRLDRRALPVVPSGGVTSVTVSWQPPSSAAIDLFTVVDVDQSVAEFDEADNTTTIRVKARSLPDLEVLSGDLQFPSSPAAGSLLAVDVFVRNRGEQDALSPTVSLYLGDSSSGQLMGTTVLAALPEGGEVQTAFSVPTSGLTGAHRLTAVVTTSSTESQTANNTAHREFAIQSGPVTASNMYFSPNGDGVKDDTQISFNQPTAQPVRIVIADAQARVVREFSVAAAATGAVSWDGADGNGKLVRDGVYRATVVTGAAPLGSVSLALDLNRSPLAAAVGTPLLELEFLADYDRLLRPRPALLVPAGEGVSFLSKDYWDGITGCGVFSRERGSGLAVRESLDGLDCNTFFFNGELTPSQDGRRLAYINTGLSQLMVFDRNTRANLALTPGWRESSITADSSFAPRFSPDAQRLLFLSSGPSNTYRLESIRVDGTGRTTLWPFRVLEAGFSPNGTKVAWVAFDGAVMVGGAGVPPVVVLPALPSFNARERRGLVSWSSDDELIVALGAGTAVRKLSLGSGLSNVLISSSLDEQGVEFSESSDALYLGRPGGNFRCPGTAPSEECTITVSPSTWVSDAVGSAPVFLRSSLGQLSQAGDFMAFQDGFVAGSLANLTNRFTARRGAGEVAFTLTGTLADLNFEGYEVTARPLQPAGAPFVLARGTAATNAGFIAQWIPTVAGLYELRVVAKDLAGNRRTRTTLVVSPDTSVRLSNVQRSPAVFSPNGDGQKDQAQVTFTTSGPMSFAVDVRAVDGGTLMRSFSQTSLAAGPDGFVWDGRTDTGAVAPDGDYVLELEGSAVPVALDVAPPAVSLTWAQQTANGPQEFARTSVEGRTCGDPASPPRTVPGVAALYRHQTTDAHAWNWTLEASAPYASTGFTPYAAGTDALLRLGSVPLFDLAGRSFRLRASDQADNEASNVASRPAERLLVLGGYVASSPNLGCIQLPGGQLVPGLDGFQAVTGSLESVAELQFPELIPGVLAIALTNSISEPLQDLRAEVSAATSLPIPAAVSSDANLVVLDTSQLTAQHSGPFTVTLRATTATGRVFTAQVTVTNGGAQNPPGACSGATSSNFQRIQIDGSVTSGMVTYRRSRDGVIEQSRPWTGSGLYDTSFLSECSYRVEVATSSVAGLPINFSQAIDVCGVFLEGASFAGDEISVNVRARTISAMSSVSLLVSLNAQGWVELASGPGFQGTTTISAPLPASLGCGQMAVRLVARMADGTAYDSIAQQSACAPPPPPLEAPCLRLLARAPVRTTTAAWCSANAAPVFQVAAEANHPLATLTASYFPFTGLPWSQAPLAFTPGQSAGLATIDTSGLSEGAYQVAFEGTDQQGGSITATLSAADVIVVDRTPPAVTLISPSSGLICLRDARSANGARVTQFDVTGTISDDAPERWAVLLRSPNQGAAGVVFEAPLVRAGSQAVSATIEADAIAPGDYELFLGARDVSGGSICTPSAIVRIQQPVRLTQASALAPTLISPDGDGAFEVAAGSVLLTAASEVTLEVHQGTTLLGSAFQLTLPAGLHALTWNGTVGGRLVADGEYRLVAVARDACSTVDRLTLAETIGVDTTAPVAHLVSPGDGATVQASVMVNGSADDENFRDYELSFGAGAAPSLWLPIHASALAVVDGPLGTADFAHLTPGSYSIRLVTRDLAGHARTTLITVELQPATALAAFIVQPPLASPEGDGLDDSAVATVTLTTQASVTIELHRNGQLIHALVTGVTQPAGPAAYPLSAQLLSGLGDGPVEARVIVGAEVATAALAIDSQPPQLAITQPASAFVGARTPVSVSVADPHLAAWQLTHRAPDGTVTLVADGTGTPGALADLIGLSEGAHLLELQAEDSAGHADVVTFAFSSDTTRPLVAFRSPQGNAFLSGLQRVAVDVVELNVAAVRLEWSPTGGAPSVIATLNALPANGELTDWDVGTQADGPGVLTVTVTDRAGNAADAALSLTLDSTPPSIVVTSPGPGAVNAFSAVLGSVEDVTLREFQVLLGQGATPAFVEIGRGTSAVVIGVLANVAGQLPDGQWTVRVRALDAAGNERQLDLALEVDTSAPIAPLGLVAAVHAPSTVALSWSTSTSADVAGYLVFRGGPAGFTVITASPLVGTTFEDVVPGDGTWRYLVRAVDQAGNISTDSNVATALVDATPPQAFLITPAPGATVSGVIEVRGTAHAIDLREYRLSLGSGAAPSSFTLLRRSSIAVLANVLGQLDTSTLTQGAVYTVLLEAEDFAGNIASARASFQTDNLSPSAPMLLSASATQRTVVVAWQGPSDSDLRGYLVYRDGALANAPSGQSFADVTPYLIPAGVFTFTDLNVGDGTHRYELQAVDQALNFSASSNSAQVTVELRAPVATIASPLHLAHLGPLTRVVASVVDQDVSSVQFEVRAHPSSTFVPLGGALSNPPYVTTLDAAQFPGAEVFELRAVAEDLSGNRDLDPRSIFVIREQSPSVSQVTTLTRGSVVTVSWTGQAAAYQVFSGSSQNAQWARWGGTATASTELPGFPASLGADSDSATAWVAGPGFPQTWELEFPNPAFVGAYTLQVTPDAALRLSVRVGQVWVGLGDFQVPQSGFVSGQLAAPLLGGAFRLEFASAPSAASVARAFIDGPVTVTGPPFVQSFGSVGTRVFTVRALTPFGLAAEGTATARVYRSTLDPLASLVSTPSLQVSGAGATAGALVDLAVNGATVAQGSADGTGRFTVSVPLTAGTNGITAVATDSLGNQSLPSLGRSTRHSPPPEAVLLLTLDSVAGSDVGLSFAVNGTTGDIAGYELRRTTGGLTSTVAVLSPNQTTALDSNVPNGVHEYVFVAHNQDGFFGAPSNVVVASLSLSLPIAPTLISATADSLAVDLVWAHSGAPAGYVVERAIAPTGAFVAVATTTTTSHRDVGLTSGVAVLYRVRARDAAGNLSDPSNVLSVTPRDLIAPAQPRLTGPTVPGSPIVLTNTRVDVTGVVAEPQMVVELFQNGASRAFATSSTQGFVFEPAGAAPGARAGAFSPDGTKLAAYVLNPSGVRELNITTLATRQTLRFPFPAGFSPFVEPPVWSPDGNRIALRSYASNFNLRILIGDVSSGVLTRLSPLPFRDEDLPKFSPDSQRVLFGLNSKAAIVDLATGLEIISPMYVEHPLWSGDGSAILGLGSLASGAYGVQRIDINTWAVTELLALSYSLIEPPTLDPTGRWLALATRSYYPIDLRALMVLDVSNGTSRVLDSSPTFTLGTVSWAPDGSFLTFTVGGDLYQSEPQGPRRLVAPIDSGRIVHLTATEYLFEGNAGIQRASLAAEFVFPQVALARGLNGFHVIARDAAGNASVPSASISVTSNPLAQTDLSVAVELLPSTVQPGDAVSALVTVQNAGPTAVIAPAVALTLVRADGSISAVPQIRLRGTLAIGQRQTALIAVPVQGLSGSGHTVLVNVDPAIETNDIDRTNNRASATLNVVQPGAQPGVSVSLGAAQLTATGSTAATIVISNPGAPTPLTVLARLLDSSGALVANLGATESYNPLPGSSSQTLVRVVSAAGLSPGDYRVEVRATDGATLVSQATAPVTILADRSAHVTLSSRRSTWQASETVVLDAVVFNDSANASLTGATLELVIPGGATPHQDSANIPVLAPGASTALSFSVQASALGAGSFIASSTLELGATVLDSTTASFAVTSAPRLIGTLDIASVGTSPRIRRGQPVVADLEIVNAGTATSTAQTVTIDFVHRLSGLVIATQSGALGALAPSVVMRTSFAAPTTGWALGGYVATASVEDQGVPTVLSSAPFEVIDGAGPTLTLLSPAQGGVIASSAAVQLSAVDDSSGVAEVLVSVDGATPMPLALVSGTSLNGMWALQLAGLSDGAHGLTVTARDGEGNQAVPHSWSVIVDTVAPIVQWVGVVDGASYDAPLAPSWVVTDLNFGSATATLDGLPFVSGSVITGEGAHRLEVIAFDAAGNMGRALASFEVDTVAPTLTLTGVRDGLVSAQTVAPRVSATDRNLVSLSVTLDGAPFVSGTPISAEGEYLLEALALDRAGHQQRLSVRFAVDRTGPLISLGGFVEGAVTRLNVTPVVNASDLHLAAVTLRLNGVEFTVGTPVTSEGPWTVEATATDAAGNQTSAVGHFTIDRTSPTVTILGVNAGDVSPVPVVPTIQTEAGASLAVQLDGAPYQPGTPISGEGAHLLIATAVDAAGNAGTAQVSFSIDLTPPVITFAGVTQGSFSAAPVSVQAFATDAHPPVIIALRLDGQPMSQGDLVSAEGPHTVSATATDAAGNLAQASLSFTLDFTPPVLTVSGVAPSAVLAAPVTLTWTASDANTVSFTATLDGVSVASGVVVGAEGPHSLTVVATDPAGNASTRTVPFELDFTAPVITIAGVVNGSFVAGVVTPVFSAADPRLASLTATLDGAPFSSGSGIASEGAHELVVVATDVSGNTSTARVSFTIDLTAPAISFTGVTEGAVGLAFSPAFTVIDTTPVTVTAQLDGAPFVAGTSVQTAGSHTLVVSATDSAGNTSTATIHFTVSGQSSRPVFRYAACGFTSVKLDNGSQVKGIGGAIASVASNGVVLLQNNTQVLGDVVAGGDVSMLNNAYVSGRGYYGGRLTLGNNASFAQGSTRLGQPPAPCECGFDLSAALDDVALHNDNQLLAGVPGFFGGRLVVASGTVMLPAGRFYLSTLEVRSSARLTTAPGANVELYVAGAVQVRNNAFLGSSPGSTALLVVSGASGATPVELRNNAVGKLLLYAPDARVEIQNNATLHGAIVGREVHLTNNQMLILDGLTQLTPPPLVCQ